MGGYDIAFEAGDFGGWMLPAAVAVLAVVHAALYVARGRRLGGSDVIIRRVIFVVVAAGVVLAATLAGGIDPATWSHGAWCSLLAAGVLPLLVGTYGRTTRPIPPSTRALLVGLRLAAGGVVLVMLARPVLQRTYERRERATVGILVDTSRSMGVRDVADGSGADDRGETAPVRLRSREDSVAEALQSNRAALARLERQTSVTYMTFDAEFQHTDGPHIGSEGRLTALQRGVDAARETLVRSGAKIAGLIVISDGRDTAGRGSDPAEAADALNLAGIPLFAVGVGSELPAGQTRSLQARRLDMPDRVSVLNRLEIGAEFLAAGLADTTIEVRLAYDDTTVDQTTVRAGDVRELLRASLSHVPTEGGLHRITVTATVPELAGPQGRASLSRYVRVIEDKLPVLYVDRARYERAAVARALEHARELHVTRVDAGSPAGAAALLNTADEWRLFRVILLGDVDRKSVSDDVLQAMAKLVRERRCGMAMLGGVRTLGSGAYADSPLDPLMPVELGAVGQIEGLVAFELTPAGRVHPICQIAESNAAAWRALPPFAGAGRLGTVAPTAEVLIRSQAGEPLLVVQEGKGRSTVSGRTAAVAFDSTWQWPFASDDGLEQHRRFWRQLVLWLANRKPEVWVLPDQPVYDLVQVRAGDERVLLQAGVNDPTERDRPRPVSITGEIVRPDGEARPLTWSATADGFEARPTVTEPGEYRVRVEGQAGDESAGESQTAFVVQRVDREMLEPLADHETLERMAGRTAGIGGTFVPLERLGELLERVRAAGTETRVSVTERRYIVDDHPWRWFVILVGLLGVEWLVRRRAGLV